MFRLATVDTVREPQTQTAQNLNQPIVVCGMRKRAVKCVVFWSEDMHGMSVRLLECTPIVVVSRAFFRRSVKCQKTYQCLNNELCGNGKDISNRLACKFCRFERCVRSGMLDKSESALTSNYRRVLELLLHSDHADRNKDHSESSFPLIQLNVFIGGNLCTVLSEFTLIKRQINYERYNFYHGKETRIATRETKSALHDWFIGMYEYDLLNQVGKRSDKLFAQIDTEDWEELLVSDYSMIWAMFSQISATLRHQGQDDMRIYLVDETYWSCTVENAAVYWGFYYDNIKDDNRDHIFNVVRSYFFEVAITLLTTVTTAFNRAKLDEAETSALLLLLFTSPSSLLVLSDHTREFLRNLKNETLRGIADHIERTGRNVDERIAEIIGLFNEFQVNIN